MNNLITLTKDGALLTAEAGKKIAEFERQIKKLEALEMEQKGIIKAVCEDVAITYIPAGERETFDSKAFRKENPRLYDKYVKLSPVKASVRIKLNGN